MSSPILATKLYIPPPRPGFVPRPRLVERLNQGCAQGCRLTLISASAGFGKTTLLGEWIRTLGKPAAWLSLEKEDNDPGRFWTYILAAIRTIQPGLGEDILEWQFASPQLQSDAGLTLLVNKIATLPDPFLLVLDDYHVIDSASIQEGMIFLLDHIPVQLHLLIASRADPPWPLARWRTRGQLAEIRAADLRFTPEEAADFLKDTMKLDLSTREISALEERTEGWIAGLQMAALSLQGREDARDFIDAFTGSSRFIFDYLMEEVFGRQPVEVQEFLLRTSILKHLSAQLCDAVLERTDSRHILDRLVQANLFLVPLDDNRKWYRYHHLFTDILSAMLKQAYPGIVPALHLRACTWYENHGFLSNAMIHALSAGDLDRLARLVERYAFTIMNVNEASFFLQWLSSLPDYIANSYPWLHIARAWLLAYVGRIDCIEAAIRSAEASAPPEDQRIWGYIAAMRTLAGELDSTSIDDGILQARKAMELLPRDESRPRAFVCLHLANLLSWTGKLSEALEVLEESTALSLSAGDIEMAMTAQIEFAALLRGQGKLHESLRMFEKTLRMSNSFDPDLPSKSLSVGFDYLYMAMIHLEWNNLKKAVDFARTGLQICKLWGYSDYLFNGYLIYSNILYETGDLENALNAIQEAKSIFSRIPPFHRVHSLEAIILLARGDMKSAENWIKQSGLSSEDIPDIAHRAEYRHFARILKAQGKLDEADRILEGLRACAERVGDVDVILDILTQQAMISQDQGNDEKALDFIQRALELAEPEGYIHIFLNKGSGMERLLLKAIAAGIDREYAKMLLEKVRESTGSTQVADQQAGTTAEMKVLLPLVEPISERELEILRLLEGSLNTPEIARELYISVGTVRTHIKNIYRKLDVNRRMEAVQRGRELGLI